MAKRVSLLQQEHTSGPDKTGAAGRPIQINATGCRLPLRVTPVPRDRVSARLLSRVHETNDLLPKNVVHYERDVRLLRHIGGDHRAVGRERRTIPNIRDGL